MFELAINKIANFHKGGFKKEVAYVVAIRTSVMQPIFLHFSENEKGLAIASFLLPQGMPTRSVHLWYQNKLVARRTFSPTGFRYWQNTDFKW